MAIVHEALVHLCPYVRRVLKYVEVLRLNSATGPQKVITPHRQECDFNDAHQRWALSYMDSKRNNFYFQKYGAKESCLLRGSQRFVAALYDPKL